MPIGPLFPLAQVWSNLQRYKWSNQTGTPHH